jgi:hypothetical protein
MLLPDLYTPNLLYVRPNVKKDLIVNRTSNLPTCNRVQQRGSLIYASFLVTQAGE